MKAVERYDLVDKITTRGYTRDPNRVVDFSDVCSGPDLNARIAIKKEVSRTLEKLNSESLQRFIWTSDLAENVSPYAKNIWQLERVLFRHAGEDIMLGRGGFGVTVAISDALAAKTNLFPEMTDWSTPFIDNQFYRYAHVASQVEEIMLGVSMNHPNILRTFGGYWCDIPDYQLGGRAVVIMERAMFSVQEFMCRVQRDTSVVPMVELDTLRGLDYLRSRRIQHRDLTYRNILVCHQPDRKPLPFAFKISDFGTSCNYSTPDQPRGNRVHMAPELLWCLNSATGSDIFSWYCVMWELYSGSPLIAYNDAAKAQGYSKNRFAFAFPNWKR
uniref:Protein kinase domain-containing protein n=1 Tax=Periophthalmus magnuspinnatus TaxID=409849 RepID=A0A3B3ZND8_9GOBI